jgi:hypothetical protein
MIIGAYIDDAFFLSIMGSFKLLVYSAEEMPYLVVLSEFYF